MAVICEVDVQYHEGKRHFTDVPIGNGKVERIPGRKDGDVVTFALPESVFLSLDPGSDPNPWQLRDPKSGKSMAIHYTNAVGTLIFAQTLG